MTTTLTLCAALARRFSCFPMIHDGEILRLITGGDDDCGRDSVEIWDGAAWDLLVFESLDYRRDLPGALAQWHTQHRPALALAA